MPSATVDPLPALGSLCLWLQNADHFCPASPYCYWRQRRINMTTLDTSPAEVLHAICAVLCPKDVAALRLTSSVLAKIGAHYLVRKVTFHTSQASLDRLQKIGDHKVFRQYVDEVHFEANLLANICCRDCWERRFVKASLDAGTSQLKEPKPPTSPTTVREKRLYSRNLKKWEEDVVDSTFHDHHTRREDQQKLHQQGPELMTKIMPQFPRLRKVRFTIARCHHALSTRFQEDFKTKLGICAPVSADTAPTGAQLKHIIAPGRKALQNLQELIISDLDPSLFEPVEGSSIMCRAFTNLKKLDISFRLPESTEQSTEPGLYDALQKGGLRDAIAWAEDLEELRVAFNGYTIDGPCIELKNILGNKSLNRLKKLSIGCVEADAKGFIEILSRQKSLKQLAMYCVSIKGSWVDVLDEMRRNLALTDATFDGFLMDDEQMYEVSEPSS